MKKSLALLNNTFESSCKITPEFHTFFTTFKKEFIAELSTINATDIKITENHFYISGFFTVNSQCFYFSMSDVRFFNNKRIMYRKVKHYRDFTGERNLYVNINVGMAKAMMAQLSSFYII